MSAETLIDRVRAAGGTVHADGDRLKLSAPRPLPEDLLEAIRANKLALLAALAAPQSAQLCGPECWGCVNLDMRFEQHATTRRTFFWRCSKGHEILEGGYGAERILIAPSSCHDYRAHGSDQRAGSP